MMQTHLKSEPSLYVLAGDAFSIFSHVDGGHAVGRDAAGVPLITWPSGNWCFPANAYMLSLLDRGMSRFNRGGTLGTYAAHIAPLIRFCSNNRVDLPDLSDSHFTLFVNSLKVARFKGGSLAPRLEPSGVISVANTCLSFLSFVGKLYGVNLVGAEAAIRAHRISSPAQGLAVVRWHHHSFPTRSPERRRLPVGRAAIALLREAAAKHSPTNYVKRRRQIMLRLLEITGARRSEIAALTVRSVLRAAAMQSPRLELVTKKGRGRNKDRVREVPISRSDARLLLEFVRTNRKVIVSRTCGATADSGILLISETTGLGLRPNTITQEMRLLVQVAGLASRVCAHMFRHRFITNVFKALIEEYHSESEDAFRRLLLSTEELKTRVCEWTGHSSLASLDRYIHLAFEEVGGVSLAVDAVRVKTAIKSFVSELDSIEFTTMSAAQFQSLQQSARDLSSEISAGERTSDQQQNPASLSAPNAVQQPRTPVK